MYEAVSKRDKKFTSQVKIHVSVAIKQATLGLERVEPSQGRRGWEEPTDAIEVFEDLLDLCHLYLYLFI